MTDQKSYFGFLGFRKNEEGSVASFASSRDLDDVRALLLSSDSPERAGNEPEKRQADPAAAGPEKSLARMMAKIVDSSHSQSELLSISTFLLPAYVGVMIDREIVVPTQKLDSIVEDAANITIYGLSEEMFRRLPAKRERLDRVERGLEALPAALLMSIVATFDSNISDVVREMLTLKSDAFQTGTKTILLSEALQADSIADIKERFISDEIYQFSRGSHEEQAQYIENNFHVAIRDHWKRWPDFIEVFERRNLIAHGEKIFTKRYTSICHKNGHKGSEKTLGTAVNLTSKYLKQAADLLLEFGILLVFSLWRKQFPAQEPDAFRNLNQVAFKLIENRNYITSIRVLNYALGLKKINMEDIIKKMMYVNLASAHRHSNEKDKCIRVLDEVDWSGSSDDYKLCVAALKDDVQKVIDLMGLVAGSGKITKSDFREWPVFDFIRDNGEFCEKYLEVFGEPLREADEVKVMELSEPDATDVVSVSREGSTVH